MSELIVYLADARAGRLIRKPNGNLQFRYDDAYTGPPISHAMPRQAEAHPHATCHAVFGGLLLEGDGRETLARTLGISPGNDYGLLAEVGGDCAGAITLLEPGAALPTETSLRPLSDDALDALLRELPQRPLGADPTEGVRLSLAGAQPKLPVVIEDGRMALPTNAATPTTHILKPEPSAFPGLVDNEAFCMRLAAAAGLLAAPVEKAVTASGLAYLIVERYDRDLTTEPIRRLHQEDFCQALGACHDRARRRARRAGGGSSRVGAGAPEPGGAGDRRAHRGAGRVGAASGQPGRQRSAVASAGSAPPRRSHGRWRRNTERIARVAGDLLSV